MMACGVIVGLPYQVDVPVGVAGRCHSSKDNVGVSILMYSRKQWNVLFINCPIPSCVVNISASPNTTTQSKSHRPCIHLCVYIIYAHLYRFIYICVYTSVGQDMLYIPHMYIHICILVHNIYIQ